MIIKRNHSVPLWQQLGLCEHPPVQCKFVIGDKVVYTNDYGCRFIIYVIGFSEEPDVELSSGFIHTSTDIEDVNGSAWWYPHTESEFVLFDPTNQEHMEIENAQAA